MKSLEKIKFLPVSPADLVLSLDRLTRFKYPEFKYYRVFNDILAKYLISPKFSKNQLQKLDTATYLCLVEQIWNESVKKYVSCSSDSKKVNNIIKNEEFSYYNLSEELKQLIDNNLNFDDVLNLIKNEPSIPLNLKRFIVNNSSDKIVLREKFNLKFPIEKVVLCEGITEEILLPSFSAKYGYDFNKYGVHLISAGGKNQVAKLYCELKDELKLPIFILLDADAAETSRVISRMKRKIDKIHVIQRGEFEDMFSLFLIKRTINSNFKNIIQCCVEDFKADKPMTKILSEYYRINNLGDFQKADFAKEIADNICGKKDLTDEIVDIIEEIKEL